MRFFRLQNTAHVLMPTRLFLRSLVIALTITAACLCANAANVNGRISGVVTDPQDAVIAGSQITATNTQTGVKYTTVSGADGGYLFAELPIGSYTVTAASQGFQMFSATGIVLNIDQEYVEPIHLKLGSASEVVQVTESSVQVDTTDMQFSNNVGAQQMTELPLIGRNFSALELILPGVQSAAGGERIGGYSVSGSQQQQTEFLINGADTNDITLNSQVLNPILDAISEFNMIDGPLNAEYDRNSGGIVSASIKSGTNSVHGDAFEFYRDTFLNTNNFFQKLVSGAYKAVSPYHQHIYGGTVGAPILKNKLFIFGAYQATPARVPETASSTPFATGNVTVYTSANLSSGNFTGDNGTTAIRPAPDPTTHVIPNWGSFSGTDPIPSTITIPGCSTPGEVWSQCAFDKNGTFPTTSFNSVALALVKKYVPAPNNGATGYSYNMTTASTSYQEDGRVDFNPNSTNQISFVGLYDFYSATNTIPFYGATIPGFGDESVEHIQQYSIDYVRQLSPTAVNDFGAHWTRFNFKSSVPQRTEAPSASGFSITPQDTASETLPQLNVSGFFTIGGTSNGPQPRIDQTYQLEDNFSKSFGAHSLKFGYDGRRFNVSNIFDANNSGYYAFNSTGSTYSTGDPSLDLLLGIPATYTQGTGAVIQADAFLNYLYAQDSWRALSNFTINYGIGYSIDTPLRNHQFDGLAVACAIPGQQSTIFPGAPLGLDYPGDKGCSISGSAVTHYNEFGPRIGFAWSPNLGALTGGPGKSSIRGGFGIYYNRTEEESSLQTLGTPPFGFTSGGAADFGGSPELVNPFADINGGQTTGTGGGAGTATEANRFPFVEPVAGYKGSFAAYEPIYNDMSGFGPGFRAPYAENFQLSIERELPAKMVARISYVGSLGRHNQITYEANPETAAGHAECVSDPVCQADRNSQALHFPQNKLTGSTTFVEMGLVGSGASSSYNGLQIGLTKAPTHGLVLQMSYTYSHALDTGSSFENAEGGNSGEGGFNQYQPSLNYGDSTYDARQRIVISPVYTVPKFAGSQFSPINLAVAGWQISGIITEATGFPYDISYAGTTSHSLYCDASLSWYYCPDVPLQTAPLSLQNPRLRNGNLSGSGAYFATTSFAAEPIGSFGNLRRNPFHGPGTNNTNAVIAKNFPFSGDASRYVQIRMESDNVFNHTQFSNPTSQYGSANFGLISSAVAARQTQLAAKIVF